MKWTLGHVGPGMLFVKQGWCLSSVAAFCICAGSLQEGQVKVSAKSFVVKQIGVGFLGWGSLSGLLGKVWAVLESLESLFPAASFGTCVELGNEKCSFHGESGLKLLDMGWLLGDAHVCGEQFGDAEEGRLCAYFLCHNMPGLYRCRTSGADGGNHGLAVRIA